MRFTPQVSIRLIHASVNDTSVHVIHGDTNTMYKLISTKRCRVGENRSIYSANTFYPAILRGLTLKVNKMQTHPSSDGHPHALQNAHL